jgi:Protein of unknown function (DUF1186)/SEC-C motif
MNVEQILLELSDARELPVAALRAANERRNAVVPAFIAEIERFLATGPDDRSESNPLFYIFHLLGSWREKSAYRPLATVLRAPSNEIDGLLGDFSTETSHRVMASVFDGDPQPLQDIILDSDADQFVRSRMLEALGMLTLRGDLPRNEMAAFLRRCWDELQPRLDCYVWEGWQSAIAMLGLSELKPLVLRAFAAGSIDPFWLTVANFESNLAYAVRHAGALPMRAEREYELFGDTITEMSRYRFGYAAAAQDGSNEDEHSEFGPAESPFDYLAMLRAPVINRRKDIGRNDACPCGSGRKFKKCCLRTPALVD